jgi:hypothetical protein
MKSLATLCFALLMTLAASLELSAFAQTRVKGYTKKDGTVVEPHRRTTPNKTEKDNWSSKPNTNPDTGKKGTKTPRQ